MSFSIDDFAVKSSPLTIAVGADHGGFEAKKELYHKAIVGDVYKKAKSVYNELLQSGAIATIKGA